MLSLTRTEGQRINITHEPSGEIFTIKIVKTKEHQVRLGFYASKNFLIDRAEISLDKSDDFGNRI